LWPDLLAKLQQSGSSMANTLGMASLVGIREGKAIIRFPQNLDTFAKQWSSNGKKDQIAQALTDLRGEPTGVKFEVGEVEASARAEMRPAPPVRSPIDPGVQDDPLVKLIVEEFGGRIVKVE
jgi:hypothetical protein